MAGRPRIVVPAGQQS